MLHLQLSDREIERVLSGQLPSARSDLVEVTRLVAHLRATTAAEAVPPMQPSLIAELAGSGTEPTGVVSLARRRAEDLARVEAKNEAERAHRRWRLLGAAAIVVMVGGVVVAGMQTAPQPSPTETDGDLAPSDRVVDLPDMTNPPATDGPAAETPVTEPPAPEAQVEVPQPPPGAEGGPGEQGQVFSEDFDWPFDWPDECNEGDWQCLWESWNPNDGPGRPDTHPGR